MARSDDVADLVARSRGGELRAVARLISLVEQRSDQLRAVMAALASIPGSAHVIGITGSPGVGKSTLTAALITAYRSRGSRVAVLAIDPTSPFSGGALLGDRIRMSEHGVDDGVFIRSMATRGHLGGLSAATPQAIRVLDSAGYDVVLVETVGVGQSEVEVADAADTALVLLAPGMGDGVQAQKAGLLEIGDLFVVNKGDRPGVEAAMRDLRAMTGRGASARSGSASDPWQPPVLRTVATTGEGVDHLVADLDAHRQWLQRNDLLRTRRLARAATEVQAIVWELLADRLGRLTEGDLLASLAADVVAGRRDPYTAADALLEQVTAPPTTPAARRPVLGRGETGRG